MRKIFAALSVTCLASLAACSLPTTDDEVQKDEVTVEKTSFKPGQSFTVTIEDEGFFALTNTGSAPITYLEAKPSKNVEGTLSLTRCSEPFTDEGKCEGEENLALPKVDLKGWRLYIAAAQTNLGPSETGYYHITTKGPDGPPAVDLVFKAKK